MYFKNVNVGCVFLGNSVIVRLCSGRNKVGKGWLLRFGVLFDGHLFLLSVDGGGCHLRRVSNRFEQAPLLKVTDVFACTQLSSKTCSEKSVVQKQVNSLTEWIQQCWFCNPSLFEVSEYPCVINLRFFHNFALVFTLQVYDHMVYIIYIIYLYIL